MTTSYPVEWAELKSFLDTRSISAQYVEFSTKYLIVAIDGPISLNCLLDKKSPTPDPSDQKDFEDNYKTGGNQSYTDSNGIELHRNRAFANTDGLKFRGTGIKGTATKNTVTDFDYKMPEDRYINGTETFLQNQEWDDSIKLQVIDIDNILGYGANFVLDEFGKDWNIATDTERQGPYILPYPALVYKDLYVRMKYDATGITNDVKFKINLFLHKKP
jgi:hypothetical protein